MPLPEPEQATPEQIAAAVLVEQKRRSPEDFEFFYRSLIIPSASGPRNLGTCMADFQQKAFEDIEPSLYAVKYGKRPKHRRFWYERTKGASKDLDLAIIICWLMAWPVRPLLIQAVAANNKQARIIEDRVIELLHYNPWLNEYVEVVQNIIRNRKDKRKVTCRIEATGRAGEAQGSTPDLLILNELVHVDKWEVMKAHRDNARKVPFNVTIVSTNAGVKGSEAWGWRKLALKDKRWICNILSEPAPWISKEDVAEAKAEDPVGSEAARLWDGKWVSGAGDALSDEDIDGIFVHKGPMVGRTPGWWFMAGLDLGVKRDHAGVTLIGIHKQQRRIRVATFKGFKPVLPNNKGVLEIDGAEVKSYVKRLGKTFGVHRVWYDQAAGGSFMAQELRREGFDMREADFNLPSWQTTMATSLVQCVKQGMLESHEDDEGRMRRDFGKFFIEFKPPNRYKLIAAADDNGHADVGFALAMMLPDAADVLGGFTLLQPDDDVTYDDDEEMTEEEWDEMPDEFKEMEEMAEEEAIEDRVDTFYRDHV